MVGMSWNLVWISFFCRPPSLPNFIKIGDGSPKKCMSWRGITPMWHGMISMSTIKMQNITTLPCEDFLLSRMRCSYMQTLFGFYLTIIWCVTLLVTTVVCLLFSCHHQGHNHMSMELHIPESINWWFFCHLHVSYYTLKLTKHFSIILWMFRIHHEIRIVIENSLMIMNFTINVMLYTYGH